MSNEAAEQSLLHWLPDGREERQAFWKAVIRHDAAERRATVERIRAALERIAADLPGEDFRGVYTILDAEAS